MSIVSRQGRQPVVATSSRSSNSYLSMDALKDMPFDELWARAQPPIPPEDVTRGMENITRSMENMVSRLSQLHLSQPTALPTNQTSTQQLRLPSGGYERLVLLDQNVVKRGVKANVLHCQRRRTAGRADADKQCQICMDKFTAGKTKVVSLPCKHEFCTSCISSWLKDHATCPVCRWQFPEKDTVLLNI